MTKTVNQYDKDLRPLKIRFLIAALLSLTVAVACVAQVRARRLEENVHKDLVKAKSGLDRLKEANVNRKKALDALKRQFGSGTIENSPERLIYEKLDEIKGRVRLGELTVTTVAREGGEVYMPYTFKFRDQNYNEVLNAISYLQEAAFPLTPVKSVEISLGDEKGKGSLIFTISGRVLTTEKVRQ